MTDWWEIPLMIWGAVSPFVSVLIVDAVRAGWRERVNRRRAQDQIELEMMRQHGNHTIEAIRAGRKFQIRTSVEGGYEINTF